MRRRCFSRSKVLSWTIISLSTFGLLSCSGKGNRRLEDEKKLYLAEFYLSQGSAARAVQQAEKIKEDSHKYDEAQALIDRLDGGDPTLDIGDPYYE